MLKQTFNLIFFIFFHTSTHVQS